MYECRTAGTPSVAMGGSVGPRCAIQERKRLRRHVVPSCGGMPRTGDPRRPSVRNRTARHNCWLRKAYRCIVVIAHEVVVCCLLTPAERRRGNDVRSRNMSHTLRSLVWELSRRGGRSRRSPVAGLEVHTRGRSKMSLAMDRPTLEFYNKLCVSISRVAAKLGQITTRRKKPPSRVGEI